MSHSGATPPDRVVVGFICSKISSSPSLGSGATVVTVLDLERMKETLYGGIVIAIAFQAYAIQETVDAQNSSVIPGGVLAIGAVSVHRCRFSERWTD